MSYRDLAPEAAAALMALDLHNQIPTFSPASVAAFLHETVLLVPSAGGATNRSISDLATMARQSSELAALRAAAAVLCPAAQGRGPLLGLIGHPQTPSSLSGKDFRDLVGVAADTPLSLPEWATWLFRELQAARAAAEGAEAKTSGNAKRRNERGCSRKTCFVPDTGCGLGHINLADCPAWTSRSEAATEAPKASEHGLLPWSGRPLGLSDLVFLAGRAHPFVVGVVGPYNAGKTTLLAAWYLLTGRGTLSKRDRQFAGSYSLAGWESVAGSLRWTPGQPLAFPPHTSSKGGTGARTAPSLRFASLIVRGRKTSCLQMRRGSGSRNGR